MKLTYIIIISFLSWVNINSQSLITIDSAATYQTFEGWEASVEIWHRPNSYDEIGDNYGVPPEYNNAKLDKLVNDMGLTALRFEFLIHMSGGREGMEPVNDNEDPFDLDESKIMWNYLDPYIREFVIPFKQQVESTGKKFYLVTSATAWSAWQWSDPEEYAEIYMAGLDRMRDKFNLVPNAIILYNEPGNVYSGPETQQDVINALIAVEKRLKADSSYDNVTIRWPSVSYIKQTLPWVDALKQAAGESLLSRVKQYDFHGYGSGNFPISSMNAIRDRATEDNVNAVMGEWWFRDPNHSASWTYMMNADDIITNLTEANVTLYQGSGDNGIVNIGYWGNFHPVAIGPKYYIFRQFYRFIEPGDVRIKASSSDSEIKVVGFVKPDGREVIVARNSGGAKDITIANLKSGTYGIKYTSTSEVDIDLPDQTINSGDSLSTIIPSDCVITIYGKSNSSGMMDIENKKQEILVYPHPAEESVRFDYTIETAGEVKITIHDNTGNLVKSFNAGFAAAGENSAEFETAGLPSGVFYYTLEVNGQFKSGKFILRK